jgi:imidazoleglycerol-phosphate dehydratase
MARKASIERKTKETQIGIALSLDGAGQTDIDTGIPFMDHMLELMGVHGLVDLQISAQGDTDIDDHHTVEDIGICLGRAIKKALGNKEGIRRYGYAFVPMDEALARVVLDLSNRPYLAYRVLPKENMTGNFNVELVKEFFRALVNEAGMTLHIELISGDDPHHAAESIFKAFGKALDDATRLEKRRQGAIPSTKGIL